MASEGNCAGLMTYVTPNFVRLMICLKKDFLRPSQMFSHMPHQEPNMSHQSTNVSLKDVLPVAGQDAGEVRGLGGRMLSD